MIKFFRHIRQRLLSDGKFGKYFLYAIGEIFLVVVGILIALQINNWNENRKDQIKVSATLTALKLNLKEDIENLNKQIDHNKQLQNNIDFAFRLISLPQYKNKRLSIYADSIGDLAHERGFSPSNTAFKSMESGSHFQWIEDQELTESIYKYYVFLDRISVVVTDNNHFVKNHMEGFIYNEMELGTYFPSINPYSGDRDLKLDNTDTFRANPVFENALIGRLLRSNSEMDMVNGAILNARELIQRIDEYLEKFPKNT